MTIVKIQIDIELTVDEELARKIHDSPPGFLCINNKPLGTEDLTFNLINGDPIEPSHIKTTVLDD